MKKTYLILLIAILSNTLWAQNDKEYDLYVHKADSLYQEKEFESSALMFQKAFDSNDGKAFPNDRYNAACSFALSGDSEKAFYHLFYSAEHPKIKYSNYSHISNDSDLNSLHSDPQWEKLLALVAANKEEIEKDFDRPLVAILDTIFQNDQSYRRQLQEIETIYGRDSEEIQNHWKLINEKDSINLIKVKKILDERGWLGPDIIGNQGNATLFLVIQHSDLETQEKYVPMMREAVKKGNARGSSLALLEDRIALRKGEKQIYGSQVGRDSDTSEYYVLPLFEPENVNERRAEVGLSTIEDYISTWDMVWDVEEYKKKLPEYEIKHQIKK